MATEQLQTIHTVDAPRVRVPSRPLPVSVIAPRSTGFRDPVIELWRYRRHMLLFGRKFMRKRYSRTWLGAMWLPLRPTLSVAMKMLVFGGIVGVSGGKTPYPVFLLISSAAWGLFSESLYWSTRSLFLSRKMLTTVHIPRLVVIVSTLIPTAADFLIGIGLAAIGLTYYFVKAHTLYLSLTWHSLFAVPLGMLLMMMLGVGVGMISGIAASRARDLRFLLAYIINTLQYMTPVVYTFQQIPNRWKPLAELNPMTGAMELFKSGLFTTDKASASALVVTGIAIVLLWGPGLWFAHRREVRDW